MRTHATLLGILAAALLAAALLWPKDHPTRTAPDTTALSPSTPTAGTGRPATSHVPAAWEEVARLLPFPTGQIAQAANLAARFTAAYATHHPGETTRQYLRRLTAMTVPHLRPVLRQTAENRPSRAPQVANAATDTIRTLGPTSIIFLTTARITPTRQLPPGPEVSERRERYAVTVLRGDRGWSVYAIELASTGDWGQSGGPS
jgi:hypothetical protein